jgi:hypothetical protein
MPIPKPEGAELEDKYISRCISEIASEYDVEGQAYAVCKSTYDKDKMSKIKDTSAKVMARIAYDTKFRGINLQAAGLEDACWDGYIAIGTKDMDGREVPNCVPLKEEMKKIQSEKGINLAEEGGSSYPWDECIADQTTRYGDEETAKKVCGYIKSEYGS